MSERIIINRGDNKVIVQEWWEWDPGFDHPDGFSIHTSIEALTQFVRAHAVYKPEYGFYPTYDNTTRHIEDEWYQKLVDAEATGDPRQQGLFFDRHDEIAEP